MSWLFWDWEQFCTMPKLKAYGIGGVMSLLLGYAWWWGFLLPQQTKEQELESSIEQVSLMLISKQGRLKQEREQVPDYEADYQELASRLPASFSEVDFLGYTSGEAEAFNLFMTRWQWERVPGVHRLAVSLQGDFSSIRALLRHMASYSDAMAITELTLNQSESDEPVLEGHFTLEFYIRPSPEEME